MHKLRELWALDKNALLVYVVLAQESKRGCARVSRKFLSQVTGITRTVTISKALADLKRAGWIKRHDTRVKNEAGEYVQRIVCYLLKPLAAATPFAKTAAASPPNAPAQAPAQQA